MFSATFLFSAVALLSAYLPVHAFPAMAGMDATRLSRELPRGFPGFPGLPSLPGLPKLPAPPSLPSLPGLPTPAGCPAVWHTVSSDLTAIFKGSDGQCTDLARAAIRAAFHDTGTFSQGLPTYAPASGGADGSLILAQEYNRPENNGLQTISTTLLGIAQNRGVGVADLIQFAGAHATVTCPGGPPVPVVVGRKDSSTPSPQGLLPSVNNTGNQLVARFADMGLSALDLAALIGAHTCAKQFFVDTSLAGEPLDDTPGVWDLDFYNNVGNPPSGVFVLQSDQALSTQSQVQPAFNQFKTDKIGWDAQFAISMAKMGLLGISTGASGLTDCNTALPLPTL